MYLETCDGGGRASADRRFSIGGFFWPLCFDRQIAASFLAMRLYWGGIMGNLNRILAAGLLIAGVSTPALAQSSASQSTTASARIVQPISLTKNSDLAFGTIVKPTTSTNTITIDETTGSRSSTGAGDAALVTSTSGRAAYTVGGEGGQTFSITVPASITMASGANTIAVTLVPTATSGTLSGTIGSAGTATFGVGGNFSLASTQASGNYTVSFSTTVAYN